MNKRNYLLSIIMITSLMALTSSSVFSKSDENQKGKSTHMQDMEAVRNMLKEKLGASYGDKIAMPTAESLAKGEKIYGSMKK